MISEDRADSMLEAVGALPSGHMLYREPNEVGGHRYWSNEIGGGVMVWDTSLAAPATLQAAMAAEREQARGGAAMSPDRFREILDFLGWSQRFAGHVFAGAERRGRRWASGAEPIPPEVARWLEEAAEIFGRMPRIGGGKNAQ